MIGSLFDAPSLTLEKTKLRRQMRAILSNLSVEEKEHASIHASQLAEQFLTCYEGRKPANIAVAVYSPMPHELSLLPLVYRLWHKRINVLLPCVVAEKMPLSFAIWHLHTPLIQPKGLPIYQPIPEETLIPDIIFVPLLAVDAHKNRLGYGKGMYDQTLASLRHINPLLKAVGVGYRQQHVPSIPVDHHDQALDTVILGDTKGKEALLY